MRQLAHGSRALGPERPEVATKLEKNAALLRETGQSIVAERMKARAIMIRVKNAVDNHIQ